MSKLHTDPHGPGPMDQLPSEKVLAIVHSDCDCYTTAERAQAWDLFRARPGFDVVMWNASADAFPS